MKVYQSACYYSKLNISWNMFILQNVQLGEYKINIIIIMMNY